MDNENKKERTDIRFKLLHTDFIDVGDLAYLAIFKIWLPSEKRLLWCYMNVDGGSFTSVDYVQDKDAENLEWPEMVLPRGSWGWEERPATMIHPYVPIIEALLPKYIELEPMVGEDPFMSNWL